MLKSPLGLGLVFWCLGKGVMVKTLQYVEPGEVVAGKPRVTAEFLSGLVREAA